ncbi:MAG: winged helix DNA-binding domain-containing protein [Solirubrobacterales bacterium]
MLAERLSAQAISGPPLASPEAVAERVLAIQAQDGTGARLAVGARTSGLSSSDVERCLNEGSLVISWLNRGTLHLVRREDYSWLHALTAPRLVTSNATRLAQEGVSPAAARRGVEAVVAAISDRGPLDRHELREVLEEAGVPIAGQALIHVLMKASIQGLILRGPLKDGWQCFVLVEDWLGKQPEVDADAALAELARRYLAGHSPADERDLSKWAGITLGQARRGLEAIAPELSEAGDGLVRLKGGGVTAKAPSARLLGPFDPILHGWASREFVIPHQRERAVVTTNGIFRPTILIDGQVAGIWRRTGGMVELEPFVKLPDKVMKGLEDEAGRVSDYLGED